MFQQLIFLALSTVVTRANPVPEPDPARILGKYVFEYRPSEEEYRSRNRPLDLENIADNDDYNAESSSSHSNYGHNSYDHSSYGHSSPGHSNSPGFMTSYSTKHRQPSIIESGQDSDEKANYVSESSGHYHKKSIIPILQSYSIIHSSKDPSTIIRGSQYSDEDEDHDLEYTQPKAIHTKARAIPISQHIEVEKPVPIPYVQKIHVPIPKGVKVHIPHPVLVPVPQPYPVNVPVAQPVAVPVIKEITIPIEKIVPYPVEKRVPVPIEKPVPYPVEKHVPVHIPQPYPVKVPVIKTIVHKHKPPRTVGVGSVTF